jgi:hypothetical protein
MQVKISLASDFAKKQADEATATRKEFQQMNLRINAALSRADQAEKALAAIRAREGGKP